MTYSIMLPFVSAEQLSEEIVGDESSAGVTGPPKEKTSLIVVFGVQFLREISI